MKLFFKRGPQGARFGGTITRSLSGKSGGELGPGLIRGFARITLALWLSSLIAASWATEPEDEVIGLWNTGGSLLNIARSEAGGLTAVVLVLDKALYVEGEPNGPVGAPRRDDMNPDPALQGRSLVGINLLSEYVFEGKKWEGQIYDPESGKTYSSNMRLGKEGVLKMRGYIGAPMFGRTTEFRSAALCDEGTVALLREGQLPGCE